MTIIGVSYLTLQSEQKCVLLVKLNLLTSTISIFKLVGRYLLKDPKITFF